MDLPRLVRIAARSAARAGLVHAYGHASARIDEGSFLVCPARPMGLIAPGEACTVVPVHGPLPEGVLGEVRLHQQLYSRRPDCGGVIRFMGPNVMALAALGRVPAMRHGFGAYFTPGVGLWDDPQLVRDDVKAIGAIDAMGQGAGLLMRGNGGVVAGASLPEALGLAFYLDDMCRIELAALAAGLADTAPVLDPATAAARATRAGGIFERMWEHLSAGDPEAEQ